MPEISRFFGLIIYMYYNDHAPPHFHIRYGGQMALVDIATGRLLRGKLSPRAHALVLEWAMAHRNELRENWRRAQAHEETLPIPPLE